MIEPCHRGALLRNATAMPARPQKREGKQLLRQHPYRRQARLEPLQLSRAEARQHSNGHTSVILPPGETRTHSPTSDLHELMAQVAAGLIAPETAAYQVVRQVGEDLGTPNTQQQQQSTADQLIHELASPADVLREGQGVSGDGSAQDDAFKTEAEPSTSWEDSALPEHIIWGPGKSARQLAVAMQRSAQKGLLPFAARISPETAEEVKTLLPDVLYNKAAQALTHPPAGASKPQRLPGTVAIISDGSGQEQVLEEARLAASALGCYAYKLGGPSSGGLSSLLPNISAVQSADVVIVVAEALDDHSLVHVISSSTESPVVAVPIDSCPILLPPGVTHVAQNHGLAAALFAARILRSAAKFRSAA